MRILQIAPPWFPVPPERYGGTELVVAGLVDRLLEDGHEVTLLASGGSTTRAELCTVYQRAPSESLGDGVVELPHALAGYRRRHEFEIVHDHTLIGVGVGALLDGPPLVHTVHGAWTQAVTRLYLAIADRVNLVAISHDQAARAPAGLRVAGVVHNGIEVADYRFAPTSAGHLAWLGRAGPDKGADLALTVAERVGLPLRLAVKINEPDERSWWREVMEPMLPGTDAEVIVNATREQKLAVLAGAEALVVPIRWDEPFGLMMIEANACGTPVVAFARGAAPEIVDDGRTGWLIPPGDLDAMCDGVVSARSIDRAACRAHVASQFTTERMARGYARVYADLAPPRTLRIPDLDDSTSRP